MIIADVLVSSTKRDTQFHEYFKSAYGASRPQIVTDGQKATSAPEFAKLYIKSKDITSTAFGLLTKFEEVSRQVDDLDTMALIENEWGEQDAVMAGLLQEGKQIGIEKYKRILSGSREAKKDAPEDVNTNSETLFFNGEKVKSVWGEVAKKQMKAVKKLVKTVQVAEEVA